MILKLALSFGVLEPGEAEPSQVKASMRVFCPKKNGRGEVAAVRKKRELAGELLRAQAYEQCSQHPP